MTDFKYLELKQLNNLNLKYKIQTARPVFTVTEPGHFTHDLNINVYISSYVIVLYNIQWSFCNLYKEGSPIH